MTLRPILRPRNLLVGAVALVAALPLTYLGLFPLFTPTPMPVPNGYDDLLAAAAMLAPRTGFYDEMEDEELEAIVAHNQPALELAGEAMQKECAVALDWSADRAWLDNVHFQRCSSLRGIARAFAAEAKQAHRDGNTKQATRCGIDNIRLGHATARGGLAIDWMVGQASHGIGFQVLRDQVDRLTLSECDDLLRELEQVKSGFEPPSEVTRRDQAFFRAINGKLQHTVTRLVVGMPRLKQQLEQIQKRLAMQHDLLRIHLVIRKFQLSENRLPGELGELNLPQGFQDPLGKGPLVYLPTDDGYLLYSVGPDGVDDGGVAWDGNTGDFLLEKTADADDSEAEISGSE